MKRGGKFVTQSMTPLIVSTRRTGTELIVEVIQRNRGRKNSLGKGKGFKKRTVHFSRDPWNLLKLECVANLKATG